MIRVYNKRQGLVGDSIYVGRPTKWGNPYVIGKDGTREQVIAKYREWLNDRPELVTALRDLKPTSLTCWCAPEPCHADVLAEYLENDS